MNRTILLVLLFLITSTSFANELKTRNEIDHQVRSLLLSQKYSELENIANSYRKDELRTTSGLWMLTLFYGAFDNIYNNKDLQSWISLSKRIDEWMEQYPQSPTPYIVKSIILKKQGWSIRGTGYSKTVKPSAWKPFYRKVDESKAVLLSNKSISSLDPHWYVVMVDIATIQSWEEEKFKSLIKEGLTKNQYYFQLYFNIMSFYTPKWHGDAKKIEAFAIKAVEQTIDKEGSGMYARIYWAASQSQFKGRLFENSNVNWSLMSKGIDDVLQKYPDQWNINNFALFSCLAKDKDKTKKLINMINDSPIRAGWLGDLRYYDYCRSWSLK